MRHPGTILTRSIDSKVSSTRLRRDEVEEARLLLDECQRFRGAVPAFVASSESLAKARRKGEAGFGTGRWGDFATAVGTEVAADTDRLIAGSADGTDFEVLERVVQEIALGTAASLLAAWLNVDGSDGEEARLSTACGADASRAERHREPANLMNCHWSAHVRPARCSARNRATSAREVTNPLPKSGRLRLIARMKLDTRYPAVSDLRLRASRRVPHFVFEYLDSSTGDEDQTRRNRSALQDIRFWPAVLEGSLEFDLSTTFLGRSYPLPFGCAPVGMSGIMWPGAEKILSAACAEAGIPYVMSHVATVRPETLAPIIGDQGWFQMYMPGRQDFRADMLRRVSEAGFHTLVLTVDVPVDSRRERQRRADLMIPPKITAGMILSMMLHPAWTSGTLREGIPSLKFCEDYVDQSEDYNSVAHAGHVIRGEPGWQDVAEIRELWDGPFLVKGIQRPEDAKRLVEMGVDGIWVSNHSGRQFDGGPASIECLPAIRDAVPETPIVFDSGVTGGLDILRALAIGADFVMLGRAFHYAVGALGRKGPPHLVHVLSDDMTANMGQMGARRLSDLAARVIPSSIPGT